ncbi:MAG: hypothetical protein IKQ91_07090 [Oscillospiraceae bacterium]|nr:hypothetical protein [Oscillospiraceae bacterium]
MTTNQTGRYQQWCSRLTRRKVLHLLKWEQPMWQFYVLLGLMTVGIVLIILGILAIRRDDPIAPEMFGGILIIIMSCCTLHVRPEKRLDLLNHYHFFEICGDIDTLHERLQNGAKQILLETDTLVLTADYLIRRGDPSTYVPYAAITAFYFGYGGEDSADLAVSASGRNVIIPIRESDRSRTDEMQQIIQAHAPQSEYGLAEWLRAYSAHR